MKKILMMLLGVALATCAMADSGDIYSILPVGDFGHIYKAGEAVQFVVRLLARDYNEERPTPFLLDYRGSNFEEDSVSNPPMLGIVVSGQLRGATILEVSPAKIKKGEDILHPYTDLICEYVVQPGDIASPIKLALNGSTENDPIIPEGEYDVNDSGYILLNGDKWRIVDPNDDWSRARLWFTERSNVKSAIDRWGFEVIGPSEFDHDLAQANFKVNAPLDPIEYLTWDADTKAMVATNTTSYTVVTKDTEKFEDKKWYVVKGTIERAGIKVNGAAHLILCDGASLTVTGADNEAGIEVPADKSLTIYGQSEGTGELKATGGEYGAGIGGNVKGTCGTITINGGTITATGGYLGAGIGGGSRTVNAATITINGGNVEAIGGTQGAGIGSGNYFEFDGSRNGTDVITINGGMITATGGKWGAGIGSGSDGLAATVTINGGSIEASTTSAEAIGQGDSAKAATTVTFAEGVEFSIVAGDDESSATETTVADYVADRSAKYVKIGPSPKVTVDEIVEGEDWTKFDVAYTLDKLEEGVDYKVLIDVTAGGVTKTITNATDIVIGSFTNTVDTVQLFGSKVFDEEAKVVLSLEAGGAVVSSSTEKTVELLPPPGDIYSITPLSEGGKGYMTGETVKFQVRLVARNYNTPTPTAYQLVYTGSGTEAEDKVSNPPMLGIVVSGQLRGATITEVRPSALHDDQTVNPYTDLICEYVVQSDDTASLITLALNGSTESAPIIPDSIDAANSSGYILLNNDKWDIQTADGSKSANLWFTSSSTADDAKGFWTQLGTAVVDYNLAEANFLVNSQGPFIVSPAEGEFFGFVDPDGFALPIHLGASDDDLKNPAGFAVKVTSCGSTLYEKQDMLFQKHDTTDIEINEGYSYDETNVMRTATITVKTPDGRVTTRTLTFGVIPKGGVIVHDLDEINAAIGKAEEEEKYPLVLVKANVIALETGDSIALPTPDTNVNVYFSSVNRDEDLFDISAIVPTFGSPYDVVTNFADSNLVYLDPEWEWSTSAKDWVIVGYTTNVLTTVEQQLAHFINTNDVAKLVYDAERQAISLVARGESEDFPWILDASTNVTAWVENSNLVIGNGLTANSYDIDLVAMTNNFATYSYTPASPLNAKVKIGEADYKTPVCWIGESDSYETLGAALEAGETKVLPCYEVVYEANGAAGSMTNSYFAAAKEATLKANAFSAVGYDFAGWATNGVDEVVYADAATVKDLASVDGSATLTAKWNATGVSIDAFDVLTNTLVAVTNQSASLPVTITLAGEIAVPQDGGITVNASPAITFAGEGMLDVSAVVPTFGTPSVVGEGFTSTNAPALFDTKGVSKLVYKDGTISLVARGESEEFPWILDATTNVTAWVESSSLVIDNGLTANSYDIDLVALTNNVATYNYTPASPLNAKVKVGEADYKTPKCWIGESDSYATLGAALEAGETTVLPGYEVVYAANGAAGSMTNSYFAAATEATLKANAFSAVGYDFAGWATNGVDEVVYADAATVKDLASVDGSATLTAQWSLNTNGVTATSFTNLTNLIAKAGQQATTLPVTIGFTSGVKIPEGETVTLPSGMGFDGLKYEDSTKMWLEDGVLYADALRGEVTVDALQLMKLANGGSIPSFQAITEGETTVTNAVVMLLGDDGKAYFNDTDDVDEMIADILAADPRPTCVKLYEVKGAMVTFEAMGGILENGTESTTYLCLPDTGYVLPDKVERDGYKLKGWYTSWKSGANEITNNQVIVNYAPQSLYAQWTSTAPTQSSKGELHLPDIVNGTPTTTIADANYRNNTTLKNVITPVHLESIGQYAFSGCTVLNKLMITSARKYSDLTPITVQVGKNAFSGCSSLEELNVGGKVAFGQSAFQNCAKLKKLVFRGDEAITYGSSAFYRCGYNNGTGELKVYMSDEFKTANTALVNDLKKWNTTLQIIPMTLTLPVKGIENINIDFSKLSTTRKLAVLVQTTVQGVPEADNVDIEYSTTLGGTWKPLKGEKTAYPDGTVLIEVTAPTGQSGFFRAVVKEK